MAFFTVVLCALGGLALAAAGGIAKKLGNSDFSRTSLEDQIDIDKELEEYRASITEKVNAEESHQLETISRLFSELKEKTEDSFPDFVEIIELKQEAAKTELSGTVMQYVKEHISKNDERFIKVLEMRPGPEKCNALEEVFKRVLEEADALFCRKLKKYVEDVQEVLCGRLKSRMDDRDKQLKEYIERLEKLEVQANKGNVDMEALINECTPMIESAGCILTMLEME